jgi:TonB-linked SusC/RagA family outer membrane protein
MKTHHIHQKAFCTLVALLLTFGANAQQSAQITGRILSNFDQEPLPGASIIVKGSTYGTVSNEDGKFSLSLNEGRSTLIISFIGFLKVEKEVVVPYNGELEIYLDPDDFTLGEVEIVSTGYEQLPKERATGSFVLMDEALLNRRFSTNILDRLEDITPGLLFNRGPGEGLRIRGRNTLFANTAPLVIVDNFPYDGPLENINPNDVENITVLMDAASASIWGAQAGNGVIVITTKSGASGKVPEVRFNSNINVIERPDLYYDPVVGVETFLDLEEYLFGRGLYTFRENNLFRPPLSPWVETLIAHRDGLISDTEKTALRSNFGASDFRQDLYRHFYQPAIQSQHFLGVSGGDRKANYNFSLGYDKNRADVVGNNDRRITLSAKGGWKLLKNEKLTFNFGFHFTENRNNRSTEVPNGFLYESLEDEFGNPLPVIRQYSRRFVENNQFGDLLDWRYFPLKELGILDFEDRQEEVRVNLAAGYQLTDWLSADVLYQQWRNNRNNHQLHPERSFFARELVNRFAQLDQNGNLVTPVPPGSIFDRTNFSADSYNFRGQLRINKDFGDKGDLSGIVGVEWREFTSIQHNARHYGFRERFGTSAVVAFNTLFPNSVNGMLGMIPAPGASHPGVTDRFESQFANFAYSYNKRYILSASARRDASNLFGVATNQRVVPLWSTGFAWILSEENFFSSSWLPYLKLRTTYGYSGNVNRSVTAFLTATSLPGALNGLTGLRYAQIANPPNPDLRWETIGTWNLGLDFSTKNNRFSGSLEYYIRNGSDLFGDLPLSRTSGVTQIRGNFAETKTNGLDLQLNVQTVTGDKFHWDTRFFLSAVNERVTAYEIEPSVSMLMGTFGTVPRVGKPLFGVYSYDWAGLDPDTGDPMGLLNGEPSTDYREILFQTTLETVNFHGPSRPSVFGSLLNSFSLGKLSMSFNISYRLGYFYKRRSVEYNSVFNGNIPHIDFESRWQQPGDELITNIPSMPQNTNSLRDNFYFHSEALVERGDNIRLQDIRLSYNTGKSIGRTLFKNAEVYLYANNLGILWKASDDPLDPDFRTMRPLASIATGIRLDF